MSISTEEQLIVDRAKAQLMEHFESVRIFVTKHSGADDETGAYTVGQGNFYAQLGQISEWVSIQDQHQRNDAIKRDSSE